MSSTDTSFNDSFNSAADDFNEQKDRVQSAQRGIAIGWIVGIVIIVLGFIVAASLLAWFLIRRNRRRREAAAAGNAAYPTYHNDGNNGNGYGQQPMAQNGWQQQPHQLPTYPSPQQSGGAQPPPWYAPSPNTAELGHSPRQGPSELGSDASTRPSEMPANTGATYDQPKEMPAAAAAADDRPRELAAGGWDRK